MCRQDLFAAFHYRAGDFEFKVEFQDLRGFSGFTDRHSHTTRRALRRGTRRTIWKAYLKRDASLQTGSDGYAFVLASPNEIDSEEISSIVSGNRPLKPKQVADQVFSAIFFLLFLRFLMFINWPEVSEVSILASRD